MRSAQRGQPKVEEPRPATAGEHDVRRLDIAMQNPALVGMVKRDRNIEDHPKAGAHPNFR